MILKTKIHIVSALHQYQLSIGPSFFVYLASRSVLCPKNREKRVEREQEEKFGPCFLMVGGEVVC
jgi:hypothetical protein